VTVSPQGVSWAVVDLQRVVDGMPTSLGWQILVGSAGVFQIDATVGEVSTWGSYALISPAAAVARLDDATFTGWSATMPGVDGENLMNDGPVATGSSDEMAVSGSAVPWPITQVDVVAASLGWALDNGSGTALLVPAYALTDALGHTTAVPALADSALVEVAR